jgi:cytochrome c-type biogenesis protein CcmH
MVSRYGDYVLLKPRLQPNTLVLWLGPFVVFLLGGWVVARRMRAATNAAAALPLSEEERALIARMKTPGDDAQ